MVYQLGRIFESWKNYENVFARLSIYQTKNKNIFLRQKVQHFGSTFVTSSINHLGFLQLE